MSATKQLIRLDSQAFTDIKVVVSLLSYLDFDEFDVSLKEIFEISISPLVGIDIESLSDDARQAVRYAWRVSHIAISMLQAMKLPCFDPGWILGVSKIETAPVEFEVRYKASTIEGIQSSIIENAHGFALVVANFLINSPTNTAKQKVLEDIKDKFVEPVSKTVFGGKSTVPLLKVAYDKKIPFFHLDRGIYQVGWGRSSCVMDRSAFGTDSAIGQKISGDKVLASKMLGLAGLPVPRHFLVSSSEEAVTAARRLGYPVVVKPANLGRGEGITINLDNAQAVHDAYEVAAKLSKRIMVEKQVPGLCHRITIVNGQTAGVVKRRPKGVEGDGKQTVRQLIDEANQIESIKVGYLRKDPFPDDEMALAAMTRAGFLMDSIPGIGELVPLRPVEKSVWGGSPEDATAYAHPANLQIAIDAAKLMGLTVAGVDYISDDISLPWYENGGIINEVNYAPSMTIRYDYFRRRAEVLMDALFPNLGRIPVHVYVGGPEASAQALQAQRQWLAKGQQCTVVTEGVTHSPTGTKVQSFTVDNLCHRTKAALMDRTVESLIVVVNSTSVLDCGLPLDRIDTLHLIDRQLAGAEDPQTTDDLIQALEALCKP